MGKKKGYKELMKDHVDRMRNEVTCEDLIEAAEEMSTKAEGSDGKIDFTVIPPNAIRCAAQVLDHGIEKHGHHAWQNVPDAGFRYYKSFRRHQQAYEEGTDFDDDSGFEHVDMMLANLMIYVSINCNEEAGSWRHDYGNKGDD